MRGVMRWSLTFFISDELRLGATTHVLLPIDPLGLRRLGLQLLRWVVLRRTLLQVVPARRRHVRSVIDRGIGQVRRVLIFPV